MKNQNIILAYLKSSAIVTFKDNTGLPMIRNDLTRLVVSCIINDPLESIIIMLVGYKLNTGHQSLRYVHYLAPLLGYASHCDNNKETRNITFL